MRALIVLIEEVAPPVYDRQSGNDQPISRAQWLALRERFLTLVAMNMPREVADDGTSLREA
jgi:hypothetical protein